MQLVFIILFRRISVELDIYLEHLPKDAYGGSLLLKFMFLLKLALSEKNFWSKVLRYLILPAAGNIIRRLSSSCKVHSYNVQYGTHQLIFQSSPSRHVPLFVPN